jgi:hypothetical protein
MVAFRCFEKKDSQWLNRCMELHELIHNIPDNHHLALKHYECL